VKLVDDIREAHRSKYGQEEIMVRAPGRANIIGEHTDYNDGFVLPFAIDKAIYMLVSKSPNNQHEIHAFNTDVTESFKDQKRDGFSRYFSSVLQSFKLRSKSTNNYNITFGGDLPIGAGVSSSSAISCGFAVAINQVEGHQLEKREILDIAVEAERGVGVEGGIMDQFSILYGLADSALCLDCRDNSWSEIPCHLLDYSFCLLDTGVEHNLAETAYNTRARTCADALRIIRQRDEQVSGFRDIGVQHLSYLEQPHRKRIEHVIRENDRVMKAVQALENKNLEALGTLLSESHISLRDLYEVSCAESDYIVDYLYAQAYSLGARMMGGGFGGSVIALIKADQLEDTIYPLKGKYEKTFGKSMNYFSVAPVQGLSIMP